MGWDMDERLRRPSGIRSLTIGDTTLSYVPDGAVQLSPRGWLPDTTDEVWARHPEWWAAPDHDRGRSTHFRRALVDELSRPRTIGFGIHFADVVFGHVRSGGDGPVWRPVAD